MLTQKKELNFSGQNIFVGFDAHLKSWKVSIMIEDLFYKTFVQPACPKTLYNYLDKHFPKGTYHTAYEAGFCGFWAHYELSKLGIKSIVVNPADIPTTGKEKVQKEDGRDSRKIVRSLQAKELVPIYVPSIENINDRSLIRMRATLTKDLSRNKQRVKSFLYFHGISYPECLSVKSSHWSKRFINWLKEIPLSESTGKEALSMLIIQVESLRLNLLSVNRKIRVLSETEKYKKQIEVLRSVPGIGLTTAMTILTELENINRFTSMDTLCGYIGLIPSTHDSGDKRSIRNITPRGHQVLRRMIIESSWIAIRTDPALSKSYLEYCKRMEPNNAIIRIARKLISRIKYVLMNNKKYEYCKVI